MSDMLSTCTSEQDSDWQSIRLADNYVCVPICSQEPVILLPTPFAPSARADVNLQLADTVPGPPEHAELMKVAAQMRPTSINLRQTVQVDRSLFLIALFETVIVSVLFNRETPVEIASVARSKIAIDRLPTGK
jgi:hypothetical protein